AAMPIEAAEMALLRVVHASQLPDPGELARRLASGDLNLPVAPAPAQPPAAEPQGALMAVPAPAVAAVPTPTAAPAPTPVETPPLAVVQAPVASLPEPEPEPATPSLPATGEAIHALLLPENALI